MQGITYMVFDQYDNRNKLLRRVVAELSDRIQTIAIMKGGVIMQLPPADKRQRRQPNPAKTDRPPDEGRSVKLRMSRLTAARAGGCGSASDRSGSSETRSGPTAHAASDAAA